MSQATHPEHYTQGSVECIDAIRAALGTEGFVAFCRGCVIKYNWRLGLKGAAEDDAHKAVVYGQWALDALADRPLTKWHK